MENCNEKPKNIETYKEWLKNLHNIECSEKNENYYNSTVSNIKDTFLKDSFWNKLIDSLKVFNSNYYSKTDYPLLTEMNLELFTKPYSSFLEKTFRKNILENPDYPKCPNRYSTWILPENWFKHINDTLRTIIIVKYLDGVEFILEQLVTLCKSENIKYSYDYEAKDKGYYAVHFYIHSSCQIPGENWETITQEFNVEIQITTQIKDSIRKMTHKFYEGRRKELDTCDKKWQWNYSDTEFTANYLGHILHYLEAMILEIRDKGETDGK